MNKKTTIQSFFRTSKKWVNKYTLTVAIFLVWLLFFDKYNVFAQHRLKRSTVELEQEYEKIQEDIVKARLEKKELLENREKYGREKYYLHKDNEDVFIIEKSKDK